jgi:hypothetical protein
MEEKDKKNELIKKVDALSKSLGFDSDKKTLIEIKKTDNPNVKELHLKSGEWDSDDPMFAIDEEDTKRAYAFIPSDAFATMVDMLRTLQKENFDLKLEKTIWQNIPQDFDDVWVVAMDEIRKLAASEKDNKPISIDLDELIKNIKAKHPNLFINLRDFYPIQQLPNNEG